MGAATAVTFLPRAKSRPSRRISLFALAPCLQVCLFTYSFDDLLYNMVKASCASK